MLLKILKETLKVRINIDQNPNSESNTRIQNPDSEFGFQIPNPESGFYLARLTVSEICIFRTSIIRPPPVDSIIRPLPRRLDNRGSKYANFGKFSILKRKFNMY